MNFVNAYMSSYVKFYIYINMRSHILYIPDLEFNYELIHTSIHV